MSGLIGFICIGFLATCFLVQFLIGILGWFIGYTETQGLPPHILEELSHMSPPRTSYESRLPSFSSERSMPGAARLWMHTNTHAQRPSALSDGGGARGLDKKVNVVDAKTELKSGEAGWMSPGCNARGSLTVMRG